MSLHSFEVFADYHQFYLWDAGVCPDSCLDFTEEDILRKVIAKPNLIVIQPLRNMNVPVDLEALASDPGYQSTDWDHIVECAIEIPTGKLQVHECTGGPVFDLAVPSGWYCVRVLFCGLDTLSADGLDGEDRYRISLWPGAPREMKVIKQHHE